MAETITILILGTGMTGTSIGLALRRASESFQRVGYDPQSKTAQQALQAGAIDRVASKPGSAAGEADLVILTLPPSQAVEAAEAIGATLRPDTVVLSTFRLQTATMEAVRSKLGAAHPCLGTVPFLGPVRVLSLDPDPLPAADVFDGGMLGIVVPPGTPQGAIDICLDLAAILKATPFFLDAAELDSATATSEGLPALVAAAAIESLSANPGWRDQRRLVGRSFARLVSPVETALAPELAAEWIANRTALIARLNALDEELAVLRDLLATGNEAALVAHLEEAAARYREWRSWRASSLPDRGVELPGMPRVSMMERLLGGRFAPKKG